MEKKKKRIKRWDYGAQETRRGRKEDGWKMDEGGEVEESVVKGEERRRKGIFLGPALDRKGKYSSLRCRFYVSDFSLDGHVTSRGFSLPDEAIRLQLLPIVVLFDFVILLLLFPVN